MEYIQEICISKANLSEKAQATCNGTTDKMPAMLKDGSRLSNRGVGAEFNTLKANIEFFK